MDKKVLYAFVIYYSARFLLFQVLQEIFANLKSCQTL